MNVVFESRFLKGEVLLFKEYDPPVPECSAVKDFVYELCASQKVHMVDINIAPSEPMPQAAATYM